MKRYIIMAVAFLILFSAGCSKKSEPKVPKVEQIQSICELATLECYYNNVAKLEKKAGNFLEKDRELWIEYEGVAKIGIDMTKVAFQLDEKTVTISLPSPELLSINIKEGSLKKDSYIVSTDGLLFKNKVTAEDQQKAVSKAQEKMKETVNSNTALFFKAEQEAKRLIENYIKKLGEVSDTTYEIIWEKVSDTQ